MNDDFLTQFRKPPREKFAAELYQRISKPMQTPFRIPALRFAALVLAAIAILTVTLLVSPPTRAFAQSILRQFGGYIFVQAAPKAERVKQGSAGQPVNKSVQNSAIGPQLKATLQASGQLSKNEVQTKPSVLTAPDAAGASRLAGFSVLAPAHLPDGYAPAGPWSFTTQDNGKAVEMAYMDAGKHFLLLQQFQYQAGQPRQTVDRSQIVDTTVRGQPGVWLPGGGKNSLVWEENGITFTLSSNTLSLDETLKVAESLGK